MKILMSAYACDPTQGSEPACGWNWAYHTAQLGHEVWCMTKIAHKENILRWMKEKPVGNLHFVFVSTGLTLDYWLRHFHFPIVYLHYLVWQRLAYRRSIELHREKNFDLVHHTSYGSLQLGSHLWKLNIPFVFGPLSGGQTVPPLLQPYLDQRRLKEQLRLWISKH